jgi:ATP synthase protein I
MTSGANGGMRNKDEPSDQLKKVGWATALGVVFLSNVAAGLIIGHYLDRWLGTSPWLFLLFLFIGMGAAIYNVLRMARRFER